MVRDGPSGLLAMRLQVLAHGLILNSSKDEEGQGPSRSLILRRAAKQRLKG
jgi:hypothetical protein